MKETKPDTPAEFTVQSQSVSDEDLDAVTGGEAIETVDTMSFPLMARIYF